MSLYAKHHLTGVATVFVLTLASVAHGQTTVFRSYQTAGGVGPYNTQAVIRPTVTPGAAAFNYHPYHTYGGYPYGGVSPYAYGTTPAQGYLTGVSSVYNAQGQYQINRAKSNILDQQAQQAKVDTQRKVFDEMMYEKANTPTMEDIREQRQYEDVRRARNQPNPPDIWSGLAMNKLMGDIARVEAENNMRGPQIPLDPEMVKRINVTTGTTVGSANMLTDLPLTWPLSLQKDTFDTPRGTVDTSLPEAIDVVKQGGRKNDPLLKVLDGIKKLKVILANQIDNLTPEEYISGKRYLTQLDSSVKLLQQPNAANYFNGAWQARGDSVSELLYGMKTQGLSFAPCAAGDEAVYNGIYQAILTYDIALGKICSRR